MGLMVMMAMASPASAQESHLSLNDSWSFCQAGKEQWYSAEVPGVVQTDLLRHGLIPDFYKGSNIDSVQWIENEDWIYKRTIVANDSLLKHGHVDLVFKGLDTFAEVYLNDSLLGKADNMFRTWEWPIKEALRPGPNELKVIFRSPIKEGSKLRDAYRIQLPHDNDPTGVSPYIRKAAYQFGWDFCPRLVTSGIWQDVELRCWSTARIRDVYVYPSDEGDTGSYAVTLLPRVDGPLNVSFQMRVSIDDTVYSGRFTKLSTYSQTPSDLGCGISRSRLWWPNGSGTRHMHAVKVELLHYGTVISTWSEQIGLREVSFSQRRGNDGRSFEFAINGKPLFIKGCNLVPPNMCPSRSSDDVWVDLVRQMQLAGMNMVRVWAGGVYPPDAFLNACDTAGILVWQDFMLANMPPGNKEFRESLNEEALDQMTRLQHHPCLALTCGNNELEVAWKNWGWQQTYRLDQREQREIWRAYKSVFDREVLKSGSAYAADYTPTSPLSNWGNAEGLKSGDLHYWGVWHGDSAFSSFKNNVGRFVSEYGFQSYPDSALLAKYNDPKELYLGSPTMKRLQRSYKTDKPIWDAIKRELGEEPKTLGEFIEASQEVQAKAYRMAIEAHMAAQPHCMGTLFWQLNDCWPGPSWSLIDYEGNWKPGMYEVQKLYGK